ncbi:peptidase [Pleurocapsa sp. CCALA 161]|uniref:PepSY-associated TM helix domain-containing protein n=1 Tax=Pleurocapsa sp. CCALA 161 TaxID=2107688 RepID=UPI000D07D392|nr:PepSY-associated TM helix domain-containing protein [Pleurocapsa sp. CCALA 161]PSB06721.1 peptidase [Pleurocapsa sp. CCALA 161]
MSSKQIRDVVFIAHRYLGLVVGILAAAIALTGSLLIIHHWTSPLFEQKVIIIPEGEPLTINAIASKVQSAFPQLTLESLQIPKEITEPITVWWVAAGDKYSSASINPYTGVFLNQPKPDNAYTTFLWNIHINLLGGEKGAYVAGVVGLLTTILCITGIILWPGWRRLVNGFKIKWNAKAKRLNFDLHKVVGIIAAVFLSMAMFTGFIWNYGTWTTPAIYAATFSPQPPEEREIVSKAIPGKTSIQLTESLIQKANAALPEGKITSVYFPTEPKGTFRVEKELPNEVWTSAYIDRYSGQIIKADSLPGQKSIGDRVMDSFVPVHFGTFAGLPSRIMYVFVGVSHTILLITGFIMWRDRKGRKSERSPIIASLSSKN